MNVEKTSIEGVVTVTPRRFEDARGFFSESWNRQTFSADGLELPEFVQDNHSFSRQKGTVRGMHYQRPPDEQGKLVRCGRGRLFDAVVDVRLGSPTYGQWVGVELSFDNGQQLWVPPGFLHGFMTLEDDTEILYKCTNYYAPASDGSVHWNSCGIDWPTPAGAVPLSSEKDEKAIMLKDFVSPFSWGA